MAKPTRVALLDGGETYAKEYMLLWNHFSEKEVNVPCYSVLIDHEDGLYLFDTGFDHAHFTTFMGGRASQSDRQTIPGQLDLLGLRPTAINYVVNSHYHFDHCGGNKHCREATTVCHACELESARKPHPFEALTYSDRSFDATGPAEPEIDIYTPRFETLRGDQEIARGLHLLETPGHTSGHYSLLVELEGRRPMLFTADAVYSQMALDKMLLPASHLDPVAGYQSIERLKRVAEERDAEIFFSHDPVAHPTYLKAPAWYV